ncbi:MAG: substrate-binding domain-containing protein [Planctomycetota bacterium]|nr:substrate-binding domain-containing protein [Planctomycetota bacterium]
MAARRKSPGRPPGTEARYKRIAEDLLRRIDAGEWPDGRELPSSRRLARAYGVGHKTVWSALRSLQAFGRVRMHPGGITRVTRRVPLASVLQGAVAVVIKEEAGDFLRKNPIGAGVLERLSRVRASLLVLQHIRWWRQEAPQGLRDGRIQGILIPGSFPPALLAQYESIGLPVVLIDQPPPGGTAHAVAVDNFRAAFEATQKLLDLGHRRLAFVRSIVSNLKNIDPDARERQDGFLAACENGGLGPGRRAVFSATFTPQSPSARDLVRARPRYTGVLCAGVSHARQLAEAARVEGLKIPRDLSIVTFRPAREDGVNWTGPVVDGEAMGRLAADLVLDPPAAPRHVRVAAAWHAGETLAAPRA